MLNAASAPFTPTTATVTHSWTFACVAGEVRRSWLSSVGLRRPAAKVVKQLPNAAALLPAAVACSMQEFNSGFQGSARARPTG